MARRVVLWDFDGTLAKRPGMWGVELAAAAAEVIPGHVLDLDALPPYLVTGFPWHQPERPHLELCDPEAWWAHVLGRLAEALVQMGYDSGVARDIALASRPRFLDPTPYRVYPEVVPTLERMTAESWEHVVLSNHVPELPAMADALGLSKHFRAVLSSGNLGYEKPHPEIFRLALEAAGDPEECWMVGDSPVADVEGAEGVGIPAVLVRRESAEAKRRAPDLVGAYEIITGRVGL